MNNYQDKNLENYFTDYCPECNGSGVSYADKENQFCPITCPTCKGSGKGTPSKSRIFYAVLGIVTLIGVGVLICKFLNI